MSFDWSEYCDLADWLLNNPNVAGTSDASLRAAMSRAYYGAYGRSLEVVAAKGEFTPTRKPQDHQRLTKHFRRSSDKDRRRISTSLNRLRKLRNKADYDDSINNLNKVARKSVLTARQVLTLVDSL